MNYTYNKDSKVSEAEITEDKGDLGFHHIKCNKNRWDINWWRGVAKKVQKGWSIYKGQQIDHSGWRGKEKDF